MVKRAFSAFSGFRSFIAVWARFQSFFICGVLRISVSSSSSGTVLYFGMKKTINIASTRIKNAESITIF